jgi:hypothetical protein
MTLDSTVTCESRGVPTRVPMGAMDPRHPNGFEADMNRRG